MSRPIWYSPAPPGFWTHSANRRTYMEWLGKKLGFREPEDWYELRWVTVSSLGGRGLLTAYNQSVPAMVMDHMPWYDWKEWLFLKVPNGFWDDPHNQRRYVDWLAEELGFEKLEDWYRLRKRDLTSRGASVLHRKYGSHVKFLKAMYPGFDWKEWLFSKVPDYFLWQDPKNQRRYLEWFGEQMGWKEPEDWYRLQVPDLNAYRGRTLARIYGSNPVAVLRSVFPEHEWQEWKCQVTSRHFWDEWDNVRRYLAWLGELLGYEEPEDWYQLRSRDIVDHHGGTLLQKCGSPCAVVMTYFPDHLWYEWLFPRIPRGFWNDPKNVRRYLGWLAEELGYESLDDWYDLRTQDLIEHRVTLADLHRHSPAAMVMAAFPEHAWQLWRFAASPRGVWDKRETRRGYLEWLGEQLGYETLEDWYQLRIEDIGGYRGYGLLHRLGSCAALVMDTWPDYEWQEWRFHRARPGFWKLRRDRRRYLDWLGEKLGFREPEHWLKLTYRDLESNHGAVLLYACRDSSADDSPITMVREVLLTTFPKRHPVYRVIAKAESARTAGRA